MLRAMSAPRSRFVTVLAWVFIVISGFGTLIGLLQNLMLHFVFADLAGQLPVQAADSAPAWERFFAAHFRGFFALVCAAMALTLAASIGLLRRRNWARLAFIGIMLFGIAWNLLGLGLQIAMFDSLGDTFGDGAPPEFGAQFRAMQGMMIAIAAIMTLGFCTLFGFVAWKLTRPAIRAEFIGVDA